MARRLLAGSLDRAVDVAATLELRGYGGDGGRSHRRLAERLTPGKGVQPFNRSRYDRRFFAVGATVLTAAIAGKLLGADSFAEYPTVAVGAPPATIALSTLLILSGLTPRTASTSLPGRGRS
jgi:hypothetical protein